MIRSTFKTFVLVMMILGISLSLNAQPSLINVIPLPAKVKTGQGSFVISDKTPLLYRGPDADAKHSASLFAESVKLFGGPALTVREMTPSDKNIPAIIFMIAKEGKLPAEGYSLKVTKKDITLTGGSGAGLFYGSQTLLQLLPITPEPDLDRPMKPLTALEVGSIEISDQPRYSYRGMHLDVSRHFFPKEFIKKYIDLIAMYKMNTFQWHLTDDNGWRIEIKKYPKLTEAGAWRVNREDLPWGERPPQKPGEKATYGGFYTQDDIREIVQYAKDRYVTIIPEIEMPAHSLEVLAAYPQFSCTGGPFTVPPGSYWPNSDILCAGNDSVFRFLEDVLTEVIELFPSQYIHIGGDEADKARWKECPKCQARIKTEGLKDENELQSYFIKRIGKFLASENRKMIGWDEILEGGLAPGATVMSWRGIEGGIAAARQGHDVIMTPTSYCYFDYYQADPEFEPKGIGGFTTLKKVYSYDPTPGEITKEQSKFILGTQGNVWTEFIPTPEQAEYMAVPRMIALAEVAWTSKDLRNWNSFRSRLTDHFKRLDYLGVNYSKGSFKVDISTKFDKTNNAIQVFLDSEQPGVPIRYTLNGIDPDLKSPVYSGPIEIKGNTYVKAGLYVDDILKEKYSERSVLFHKATGRDVRYLQPYSYRYTAGGDLALTDGLRGTINHRDGSWQGYLGNDFEVIVDLGEVDSIMSVAITFLQIQKSWIFMPDTVIVSLSQDNKRYHSINEIRNDVPQKTERPVIKQFSQGFPKTRARYIKIRAVSPHTCPPWHEGAGEPCWLFTDEIVVY